MKKTQLYGIVAIALGALLVLPVFLEAFGFSVIGFSIGGTYLELLEDLNFDVAFTGVLMQVGLILTLVGALALIVYGILLLAMNKEELLKLNMILTIVVGAIAIVTFVATLLYANETLSEINEGAPAGLKANLELGVGAILFAVFGVFSVASSFVLKLVKK